MSEFNRVVWSEGMFLRPHHFQQHDRFIERYIHQRCAGLQPYFWGLSQIELDKQHLAMGKIAIRRCSGVFQDGTPFDIPTTDHAPEPLEPPSDLHNGVIYLALSTRRAGVVETDSDDSMGNMARYVISEEEVRDSNTVTSAPDAPLQVGSLRLRFMHEEEERDGYLCIGVARVIEVKSDHTVVLDEDYIPPTLNCRLEPNLYGYIKEIQGLLRTRGEALAGRVSEAGRGGTAEIADFMLLQVVNRVGPLFSHFLKVESIHPESLYQQLIQLAGELSSFEKTRLTPEIEAYTHDALDLSFRSIMDSLRHSLGAVIEQNAVMLPLSPPKYGIRAAKITDRSLLDNAIFVLAVHADIPADALRQRFPSQVKIGPVEYIQKLVQSALPGIPLQALPVAPRQIPYHAGFCYFELEKQSKVWQQMSNSGGFAIHVGGDFPAIELEFWAIKGQ